MTRGAALLAVLWLLAVPAAAQTLCGTGGSARLAVVGPEQPDNLWQQAAYIEFWQSANDLYGVPADEGALVYWQGQFYAQFTGSMATTWGGSCPAAGAEIIGAIEYCGDENTLSQRGFYAVGSLLASSDVAEAICTMHEIPQPSAVVDGGTVSLTWAACPEQASGLVTGYLVQRSADGLGNWADVGAIVTSSAATDTPGPGTWYYALQLRFQGAGIDRMTPQHGLAVQVVVP